MGKVDKDIETLVSEGSVMPDGRRADTARAQLEYKNQLKNAGDIYVGTGDYIVNSDGTGNEIYITEGKNIQDAIREDANRQQGLRLGEGTSSSYSNIVELGIGAKTEANGACQIGAGTNNVANSLQFRDKTVVNGNGEIVGDYPLGFTKRQTSVSDDGWPKNHSDLVDGTVVTGWCYGEGGNANIAFVKTYDSTAQTSDLNLVIDGNIYVEEGLRRVYAEGDKVGSAVNADNAGKLNNITLTSVDQIINKDDGSIKIDGCVSFVMFDTGVKLDSDHTIPANSKGIIVGTATSDLAIIYTTDSHSGCLYYSAAGKNWSNGYPNDAYHATEADHATSATNAEKTSFSNVFNYKSSSNEVNITNSGTYQFFHKQLGFSCLLHYDRTPSRTPIFVSRVEIYDDGSHFGIYINQKFYMQITADGKIEWYKEEMKLSGGDGYNYSLDINWKEFDPVRSTDSNYYIYYRKIT